MKKYTFFMSFAMWAFIILLFVQCACGMQAQTLTSEPTVNTESPDVQIPAQVLAEPTEKTSPVIYVTTSPLNVRSEANADSEILGVLEQGTVIVIFIPIPEIKGDDCYMGEWYETNWNDVTGYVCSLYVEER